MSNNPFEAVAAAASGSTLKANGSDMSSLSSSTAELPSVAGLADSVASSNTSTVDISRHPSGIVPILQ